jgi:TolB-like protein/DNA-binding SARP family transcriptional activator/Tfp pilus assembly protein PilF
VAEWFKAAVLKTAVGASPPWVRIPPSPPRSRLAKLNCSSYAPQLMADEGTSRHDLWASEASLTLLGPLRLLGRSGDDLTPKARKTRALLAIISLSKGPVPRAKLTNLLWGDRGEEQAKASLRQALYELRELSSGGLLSVSREFIEAGPKRISTDLGAIEDALSRSDAEGLADALAEVRWPPLADLDDVTPELDEWLRDQRTRIATQILQRGNDLAATALSSGKAGETRRIADGLEQIDPLDERAVQAGARADIALSDRAAAHRRVSRFEQRLRDELGIEPSPATRALLSDTRAPKAASRAAREETSRPFPAKSSRNRWLVPVALLALLVVAALLTYVLRSGSADASPSVAVLPFEEAGQKTQDYFASGVSDEILNLLSHEKDVRVLGRVSAEQIANRPNSLEIARNLHITHLLDGSVRTSGNRVLVIVTLTRVSDGAQLWSERYERRLGDIFEVQGDIARTVASRLARSFGKAVNQATSPEVYDRYLAARQLLRERRDVTLKEAERLLRECIQLDPRYAPAYAELAQVLMLRSDHPTSYGTLPLQQARAQAAQLARKAIQLDPNLGDAYAAMGFLYVYDERALPYYRKAVELSPQRSEYHRWLAQSLMIANRFDEGIEEYRRALEIDPLWGINYEHLTGALLFVGKDEEAASLARRFMALSTDDRAKLQLLRGLANSEGRLADNLRFSRLLATRYPDERVFRFYLASALALLGERDGAAALVDSDPIAQAILHADWPRFSMAASGLGRDYWDRANTWNSARLFLATGRSSELVRLYDEAKPLVQSGEIDRIAIAIPEVVLALRQAGRRAEADKLLEDFRANSAKLPHSGLGGTFRDVNLALIAILSGREEDAMARVEALSRRYPAGLSIIPAMSLFNDPFFGRLKNDPRLASSDERVRDYVNRERRKAGLPPIGRDAWISDPNTLLTKN